MELKKETLAFYVGVMVGVMGNFFVSCSVEIVKSVFEKAASHIIGYWGFMFMLSSVLFFQITKWGMKKLEPRIHFLWLFHVATIICIALGIIVIVYGFT